MAIQIGHTDAQISMKWIYAGSYACGALFGMFAGVQIEV